MNIYQTTKQELQQPVLLLDEKRCKRNISRMVDKVNQAGCTFRPHFKTHQSREVGRWFRELGVTGITTSSPSMALYFAQDGWDDLTIAFPFFPGMLPGLKELEKFASLRLFVNSVSHLQLLSEELLNPFSFYIEIDSGSGRSGQYYKNHNQIKKLINKSNGLGNCSFHGFYIHDGRTYQARGKQQIIEIANSPYSAMRYLKKEYPFAQTSVGDTPSASILDNFEGIDELTPGNFVFYDWMQVQIGSCSLDDVALFAVLPLGQKISDGKAILHGGAVHLSKDMIEVNETPQFGKPVHYSRDSTIMEMDGYISALSQEHGTLVSGDEKLLNRDSVCICPIHSCLTANLHSTYLRPDGSRIEKRILS